MLNTSSSCSSSTVQLNTSEETSTPKNGDIHHGESGSNNQSSTRPESESDVYGIADAAPWSLSILCGIQHFLAMIGTTLSVPHLLFAAYCLAQDNPARAQCASSIYFVCGIVTILQSAVGTRLPVMHGSSYSYLVPILIVLERPHWHCPPGIAPDSTNTTLPEDQAWNQRISFVQGAMIVASVFEILLSLTGMITLLLRFITPLVCTPVITLVGLALMKEALDYASGNWGISFLTSILLIIFSEHFRKLRLPFPSFSATDGFKISRGIYIFRIFPVVMVLMIVWLLCFVLTQFDVFTADNKARTDLNQVMLDRASWFSVPYPFRWGYPKFNIVCTAAMMGATLNKIITSIGNFYASARISEAPPPPIHVINRGIFVQGLGNLLDGLVGIGSGISSNVQNAVIIGMTKVASRRTMYVAGSLLIFIGVFTKVGAVIMTIPDPIIGGTLVVLCSSIVTMGITNLKYVDLNSSRNLLTVGIPLFCGLAVPAWLDRNRDFISTGNETVDGIFTVLLGTSTFVGFVVGILLDNLIPGTPEQRGLVKWLNYANRNENQKNIYDLPFSYHSSCDKCCVWKFIPIVPQYASASCCCAPSYIEKATCTAKSKSNSPH